MALRSFDAIPEDSYRKNNSTSNNQPMAVFLVILFTITLLLLMGRGMYDVNRLFNPDYNDCIGNGFTSSTCDSYQYYWNRDLNWSYITLPLFFTYLLIALNLRTKRHEIFRKTFLRSFIFLLSTIVGLVFYYLAHFLFTFHRMLAWYFLFGAATIILLGLAFYLDRKNRGEKVESEEDEEDDY